MKARFITMTALALAVLTAGCAEDATSPVGPDARRVARPRLPERTTIDQTTLLERQTVTADGSEFAFERHVRDGSVIESRIMKDGQLFVTLAGDIAVLNQYSEISMTAWDEGMAVFSEQVILQSPGAAGPRRMKNLDLPCEEQLAIFAGASAYLSYQLARARIGVGSRRLIYAATIAVGKAAYDLWQCLRAADQVVNP